jgi:hypothetical protein
LSRRQVSRPGSPSRNQPSGGEPNPGDGNVHPSNPSRKQPASHKPTRQAGTPALRVLAESDLPYQIMTFDPTGPAGRTGGWGLTAARGLDVRLAPAALVRLTNARLYQLTRPEA